MHFKIFSLDVIFITAKLISERERELHITFEVLALPE